MQNAKLRLYVTNDSTSGGTFTKVTNTTWAETITWNTKPAIDGPLLATLGAVALNTSYEVDVTGAITGNGDHDNDGGGDDGGGNDGGGDDGDCNDGNDGDGVGDDGNDVGPKYSHLIDRT